MKKKLHIAIEEYTKRKKDDIDIMRYKTRPHHLTYDLTHEFYYGIDWYYATKDNLLLKLKRCISAPDSPIIDMKKHNSAKYFDEVNLEDLL